MESVIVIGSSGHAAELQDYIREINDRSGSPLLRIRGYIDDDKLSYDRYQFEAPYLGTITGHRPDPDVRYVIAIASNSHRRRIVQQFLDGGAGFVTVRHPMAIVSPSARVGEGCILAPNVNVGPNVSVGDYSLLNARCSLGHDTVLGSFNVVSPNVSFSGGTRVGDDNFFGINSATKPGIVVGNRNKIEAGMVLDRNIGDDQVVFFRYREKVIAVPKQ